MNKNIAVIGYDTLAGKAYANQIKEVFGKYATIRNYSILDNSYLNIVPSDLYMLSTDALDALDNPDFYLKGSGQRMEIKVTYRKSAIKALKKIPENTEVLFVNITEIMAREAVTQLEQLGVTHLKFVPYAPGTQLRHPVKIAVTPDELRYVPKEMEKTVDIGQRVCSTDTMIEAALRLNLLNILEEKEFKIYKNAVATNSYYFDRIWDYSNRLESQFDILMESLERGIVAVNENGQVYAVNSSAEKIIRFSSKEIIGKSAVELFPYLPLQNILTNQMPFDPEVIRIHGKLVTVHIRQILRKQQFMGMFIILQPFKEAEEQQNQLRSQLIKKSKGRQAKYYFSDVIGNSAVMEQTKALLKKMAVTDLPILLVGETGTGKELFAHSIHHASKRANQEFVAINCAALSESLLESELFGYEDGAFTGAKKGGSPGVFEFAHLGTIFLDEVEGMSPALQVKLLRVLQEGEIIRVGGNQVIHVDVRIIAATNEELEEKVANGTFRKDLYYRLNTFPVYLPPLKDRGNDLFQLIEYFKVKKGGKFNLSPEVKRAFLNYSWPGNVRELHNVVDYLIFLGNDEVELKDLPPTISLQEEKKRHFDHPELQKNLKLPKPNLTREVLQILYERNQSGQTAGRESILKELTDKGFHVTQIQIRKILKNLEEEEAIIIKTGRGGSQITEKGIDQILTDN